MKKYILLEGFDDDNQDDFQPPSLRTFDEILKEALRSELQFNQVSPLEHGQSCNPQQTPSTTSSSSPYVNVAHNAIPDISSAARQSSRKRPEVDRRWKKCDSKTNLPEYYGDDTGAVEACFSGCETPTSTILVLIDSMLDYIVHQSYLYVTTKNKTLNLKKEELIVFIGVNFYMGYNSRPAWTDHYSSAPILYEQRSYIDLRQYKQYNKIISSLHCNENLMMPRNCKDKLFKIRPIIEVLEELNRKYQECYHETRALSVDESVIKFNGRWVLKLNLPMKFIILWCLADQRGFIKKFMIYQGKDEEMTAKFADYSLGERFVL